MKLPSAVHAEPVDELSGLVHMPLRLTPEQQRLMRNDPEEVKEAVSAQVETALTEQTITRLLGAVERRLEELLELDPNQLAGQDQDVLEEQVTSAVENMFEKRKARLVGDGDQLGKDIDAALAKISGPLMADHLVGLLMLMPQGSRSTFDKKTHRRVWQRTNRLTYIFKVANFWMALGQKKSPRKFWIILSLLSQLYGLHMA